MINKKKLLFIIKAVISIALLLFIIVRIDWNEVAENLRRANYLLIFAAFLLNIIERAELTYKWNLLIWARGIDVSFTKLFLINSIGGFWGLFLPSSLGTDVVRGYYLVKNNSEKSASVSSIFVDRILGMFSLLLLGVVSLLIAGDLISNMNIGYYFLILFMAALILFYFFQKEETALYLEKLFLKIPFKKFTGLLTKLHFSILEYKKHPKSLLLSFAVTLLVQITRVLTYYFIAIAFNINIPIVYFFLFVPLIMIVIMVPISIGGLGVREGTFITFFTLVGMSMNDAVVISFTNTFINTVITLLGGFVYLFYNSSDKIPNPAKGIIFGNSKSLESKKIQ
jgi:hypothetical protein